MREYLPRLRANPAAVSHLEVVDSRAVWCRKSRELCRLYRQDLPYRLRQPPHGTQCPGRRQVHVPNKYNIYLHDTPSKSLFGREVRAFSHGCVRVGEPSDLAKVLLDPQTDDPRGLFRSQLGSGVIRLNRRCRSTWSISPPGRRWGAHRWRLWPRRAVGSAALARIGGGVRGGDDYPDDRSGGDDDRPFRPQGSLAATVAQIAERLVPKPRAICRSA